MDDTPEMSPHCSLSQRLDPELVSCATGQAVIQQGYRVLYFNAICLAARVSKTFLYNPKHSDLAQQIQSLRQLNPQSATSKPITSKKSDPAKDAQIVRFKERIRTLEEQVRALQEENELLYGKLSSRQSV
jgi:ABC-type oligopeptide transport system ATPase subunit